MNLRRDEGMSLIELTMAIGLLALVIVAVLTTLNVTQTNIDKQMSRSDSNDQLRQAFQSIDREVRSGNVLYDPTQEVFAGGDVAAGMSLRIYTQANAPTRGSQAWCVQWRITSSRELQSRRWLPGWTDATNTSQVTGWRTVATGLTNRTDNVAAFSRIGSAGNLLSVRLRANNDPSAKKGSAIEVQQAVSGRNTQFYPAATSCGAAVPDPALVNPKDSTRVPPY